MRERGVRARCGQRCWGVVGMGAFFHRSKRDSDWLVAAATQIGRHISQGNNDLCERAASQGRPAYARGAQPTRPDPCHPPPESQHTHRVQLRQRLFKVQHRRRVGRLAQRPEAAEERGQPFRATGALALGRWHIGWRGCLHHDAAARRSLLLLLLPRRLRPPSAGQQAARAKALAEALHRWGQRIASQPLAARLASQPTENTLLGGAQHPVSDLQAAKLCQRRSPDAKRSLRGSRAVFKACGVGEKRG